MVGDPGSIPRVYESVLRRHLASYRQMAFLTGARQVGKTTTCRATAPEAQYLSWDDPAAKRLILAGPESVAREAGLDRLRVGKRTVVFDEIHKHRRWKGFLKGFFDLYGERTTILVTGSSRLDAWRRGGDSLMGRYFLYRMHPISVAERLRTDLPEEPTAGPAPIGDDDFGALWEHGGYPEPFLHRDRRFTNRWRGLRMQQLLREDLRDLTQVQDVGQIETLATLLTEATTGTVVYSRLASEINASVDTVRRWIATLSSLYFGFLVRPWFKNVARSLRKEPKWYCSDWSVVADPGHRAETFVACHLLKAVQGWTDLGFGDFELRYLRDKDRHEVDFLVVRDRKPWFLVEVKHSDRTLSPDLARFQEQTRAPHAFQAVVAMDHVQADCFARKDPCVVPARTLLSQLL